MSEIEKSGGKRAKLVEAAKNPIGLAALMVVVLAPFLWAEIETWQTAAVLGALILLVGWVSWLYYKNQRGIIYLSNH